MRRLVLPLLALSSLAGCGLKGDLFLPAPEPAPAAEPAPPPPDATDEDEAPGKPAPPTR